MKRRDEAAPSFYQLLWLRWEDYRIHTDGWFYPTGSKRDSYDPGQEEGLPAALARINKAWKRRRLGGATDIAEDIVVRSIMDFLRQFGFLGLTHLQEKAGVRKVEIDGKKQLTVGDRFSWVIDHAENVDVCLSLAGALRTGQHERLAGIFKYVEETRPRLFPGLPIQIPTLTEDVHVLDLTTLYAPSSSITEKAHALLRASLAPNLGKVERIYDPALGRSVFQFQALIQLIYWQLADWINGERWRECRECHVFFCARDERQVFCPPPTDVRESRCARRARMRMLRSREAGLKQLPEGGGNHAETPRES